MSQRFFLLSLFFTLLYLLIGCSAFNLEQTDPGEMATSLNEQFATNSLKNDNLFYYHFDERIFLEERKNLVAICFQNEPALLKFISELNPLSALMTWSQSPSRSSNRNNPYNILILRSLSAEVTTEQRKELASLPEVRYVSPLLGLDEQHLSSVSNEFSVKLRKRSDYSTFESIVRQYNCEIICHEGLDQGIFLVRLPKDSESDVIHLSTVFYETGLFEFSSPCFFWFGTMDSADPFFTDQWGLKNTGQHGLSGIDINIEAAWTITEGNSDIVVAILDQGIELSHSDLSNNLVSGYDAVQPSNMSGGAALENESYHGTAVAGIIGATRNNGIGISGVAPGCRIMPVRIGYYDTINEEYCLYSVDAAAGFNWARDHGADVINCSWHVTNPCALLTGAIQNATTLGRNGKGCVVLFAAGNEGSSVFYPASLYYVIAVGAISYDGKRKTAISPDNEFWWSSNYGPTLDVMAPGVYIPTTDKAGVYGINSSLLNDLHKYNDYTDKNYSLWGSGTSIATPHVSGIAALILSEYPDLPQDYVRRAIELGCIRHSAYTYVEDGEYPMDYRNDEVGHGLVKANLALGMASQFSIQNTLDHTSGIDFTILNSSSYNLDDVIIDIRGSINNQTEWLVSSDIFGGILSGYQAGYPVYRGLSLSASPGTPITSINFELFASCIDCPGELEIGVAFDTPTPNVYEHFSFGLGETYQKSLPDITVPNGSRRRVYVRIFDSNQ